MTDVCRRRAVAGSFRLLLSSHLRHSLSFLYHRLFFFSFFFFPSCLAAGRLSKREREKRVCRHQSSLEPSLSFHNLRTEAARDCRSIFSQRKECDYRRATKPDCQEKKNIKRALRKKIDKMPPAW